MKVSVRSFILPAMEPGSPSIPKPDAAPEPPLNPRMESLVAAAEVIFLSKGYHNATMSDIARRAGMSKRTVYTLVSSKVELFAELLAHRKSKLQFPTPAPDEPVEETLCANLLCLAKFLLDPAQIAISRMVITEYGHNPDFSNIFLSSRLRKAQSHMETCLLDLALTHGATREEARESASMLFGMALGDFLFNALSGFRALPSPKAVEERIRTSVGIFLAGCKAEHGSRVR
ncbi:MAG: TetR/AcrR family transcriptional regulator [Rhodospirillales bacterium]|nr:TetR/AcrR family transcriptional regulator [Rhodospirillales bacterium]